MNNKTIFSTICWVSLLCNLVVAQDKTPILIDNFDKNSNGWAETSFEEGDFAIKDGFYEFEHKRTRGAWTNAINIEIPIDKNYEIVASIKTVKSLDTRNFGLVWGKDDDGNQYEFTINRNGEYSIEKQENYERIPMAYQRWIVSSAIKEGDEAINELKIVRTGLELAFYINNTKVHVLRHPKFYGNQIGFKVNANQKIAIDFLKINSIEPKVMADQK